MRQARCFSLLATALLVAAAPVRAQPWTPPRGEGSVALTYQNYYLTGHYSVDGRETPNGATHSKTIAAEVDFGLTDRLALRVGLPFISSKYTGPRPSYFVAGRETFPGPLDDGTYHGAIQDWRLDLRAGFTKGPVAFAPLIGIVIPSHDYETVGEAVPGRDRVEFVSGISAGLPLEPLLPGSYVQAQYALGVAEVLLGYPAVRSIIDLEGGSRITPRMSVRGMARWQLRHDAPSPAEFFDDWVIHDRFMVSSYTNLGGGVTIRLTQSTELSADWMATISGKFGAHISRMLTVGVSRTFGTGFKGFGAERDAGKPDD